MIHLEELIIHQFRGIVHLPLSLGGKNFAVCGPNGTGKSGVVDAIEFVLTGTISRLTGKGRGDLSIKDHGPHVDSSPDKAYVECVVWAPSINKRITIKRTVKKPRAPDIRPDLPIVRDLIARIEQHPEIALSRREIIRYVLTEPGQRAKDIQALLKLDELEELRTKLQKIARAEEAVAHAAERTRQQSAEDLMRAMTISQPGAAEIIAAANQRRKVLEVEPLATLSNETSLRDGIATKLATDSGPAVNKASAAADAVAVLETLANRCSEDFLSQVSSAVAAIEALRADATLLQAVEREDLLSSALELYDGETCPVCETEFSRDEFVAIIATKQAKLTEVKRLRNEAEGRLAPIIASLEAETAALRTIYPHVKSLLHADDLAIVVKSSQEIKSAIEPLADLLPLESAIAALTTVADSPVSSAVVQRLQTAITALPEPSEQEAASVYLTIAEERLQKFRTANIAHQAAQLRAISARRVFEVYADTTTTALEKIYQEVQTNFADLYRESNADDESSFQAELTPSIGKLGFNVDFYKRGFFPPGAFHSEGHQDSMGLCLYLALMKYLLGGAFTIAVLDDVLMSVDAGHRREVSRMLTSKFPGTQFILTTHDKTWLKQLTTAGLVEPKKVIHFRKWTVGDGPSAWGGADVWTEIEAYLVADDVHTAAGTLRRTLEHLMAEQCEAFRAKVAFNADGRHDLGDLLDPAINQFRLLLDEAIKAAESWDDTDRAERLYKRRDAFANAVKAALGEQWQMNAAIHNNEWANLQVGEFRPLVKAFQNLAEQFVCYKCKGQLEVTPPKASKEHLQCLCGVESYSFKKKPKDKIAATAA